VKLRWVDGDWKLLNITNTDGPVPMVDTATPTAASQLIPRSKPLRSSPMHQDRRRAWTRAVPVLIALLAIEVGDRMSAALSNNASADAQKFMTDAGSALAALGAGTLNPAAPVFGVLLGALIVVLGALSIWLELLLRSAAIYISVLLLPPALVAMTWPSHVMAAQRSALRSPT
jgi:hypothetical protein